VEHLAKAEILSFVKSIQVKEHAILFYSNPEDKHEVLFTYLKAGLDAGEAAIYVASDEPAGEIREAMKEFGLDISRYERSGALRVVDYWEWYIIDGKFDIGRTLSLWKQSLQEAVARGFKGLRVTGEMSCFFRNHMLNELVIYERALHRELTIPMEAICAYDDSVVLKGAEDDRYLRIYMDLITAHATILFVGPQDAGVIRAV
jgi:hypothetical protein